MKSDRIWVIQKRIWFAAVMCALLALFCVSAAGVATAYPALDPSAEVTVTVHAAVPNSDSPISGLRVTLYKAGDMTISEDGMASFTLTPAFASYDGKVEANLDPNKMDSSSWAKGAATLAPYVVSDSTKGGQAFETISAVTGEDGSAHFQGLDQGLYLMTASYEGDVYKDVTITPAFLTLPQISKDNKVWDYNASVKVKPQITPKETEKPNETEKSKETEKPTTSVSVRKVWSGDDAAGTSSRRPASVTIELHNSAGVTLDTQTLSAQNGRAFTWAGLEAGEYSVTEKDIPAGYSVSHEEQKTADGKLVTVTNTTPPAGVQGESREREVEAENRAGVKGSSREKETEKNAAVASANRLPQTGQLWWPVWVLAGIAAVLLILGLILRLSGKKDMKGH